MRIKPNRLGRRESTMNHNDFFKKVNTEKSGSSFGQAHASKDSELVKSTAFDSQKLAPTPNGNCSLSESSTQQTCCSHNIEFKNLMIAHMTTIKEHLVRLEAKIGHHSSINKSEASGIVDANELKKFGIPVDSEDKLVALNNHLKDEGFGNNLVRGRDF